LRQGLDALSQNKFSVLRNKRVERTVLVIENFFMEESKLTRFNSAILPLLPAAYQFARWLTHNSSEAEDLVQEAFLRAFQFFDGFRGENARAWLLSIVRNVFYTSLRQGRGHLPEAEFDEKIHLGDECPFLPPDESLLLKTDKQALGLALAALPVAFREIIVLREIEEMSYQEISALTQVPLGTVMSRLARARRLLQNFMAPQYEKEEAHELRN